MGRLWRELIQLMQLHLQSIQESTLLINVNAACHAHSVYGKTWSTFGQCLDPITQDSCAFYEHHDVFKQYSGLVLEKSEGDEIAKLLSIKALILQTMAC